MFLEYDKSNELSRLTDVKCEKTDRIRWFLRIPVMKKVGTESL